MHGHVGIASEPPRSGAPEARRLISVVSPCYNEEAGLLECYEQVKRTFAEHLPNYDYEHVFADNGSKDRTPELLRELASRDKNVKVILNSRNFGPFRSMFNALRHARGDAVIPFMPIDMQDPPALIPEFVKLWEGGYEVVAGARTARQESVVMRAARSVFYRLVNRLADFEIPENVGEFQLLDRRVVDAVLTYRDQYPFLRGMIASVGFRRVIVPYPWSKRAHGLSRSSLFSLIDQALNGVFSFTNAPMRLCSFVGTVVSAVCLLYAAFAVIATLVAPGVAPRGTMTVIVALFFLSGLQLLFVGVLGEYVTTIHRQVRGGPMVVERETLNLGAGASGADQPAERVQPAASRVP